ncbi:YIP1 family protein [Pararhodobacter oceanensis]|uniref:Yip1 domain-containing protein n=1 Tax=Pararhodobacter oceanensis TaxID=2172121 RepID=A0A2T8HR83_9RHOB|nr:YIP1 family protein [Pararhodobacter oceanensis]PVH27944.1 hypothetical protein DDE20_14355 [Pararhodobacter oceanensis]
MTQTSTLLALARLSVVDPEAGGRAVIAVNPPLVVRWMLLSAAILVSVLLFYAVPFMSGQLEMMPPPVGFAAAQFGLNVLVVGLVAYVGRGFGGTGSFDDALWLMAWLQAVTVVLFVLQLVAILALPGLNVLVTLFSIIISLWMLTGFICALHGFRSRAMVLVGGVMVFTIMSFVLSVILLFLGFDFSGVSDV